MIQLNPNSIHGKNFLLPNSIQVLLVEVYQAFLIGKDEELSKL